MDIRPQERSWVELDLAAFAHNLELLKSYLLPGQDFLQIVKADAYGHGALEISRIALEKGAAYLGVANLEEGKLLRLQGIKAPILLLSPSLSHEIPQIIDYALVPAVSDFVFAKALSDAAENPVKIHIKLDTGMHRSGVRPEAALAFYQQISGLPHLEIEGVFSHFASAESDVAFCEFQEALFERFLSSLPAKPRYIHINNSAASILGYGKHSNLVRYGILAFGVDSFGDGRLGEKLKAVMSFKSSISQIKTILAAESIGYNRAWTALRDGLYAVIPVGYADGYDFLLSNKAKVLLNGHLCPVLGRISMDMTVIDISDVPDAKTGDELCLIGCETPEIRAENLVALYQGSSYELLCQVGRRAKRYYVENGRLLHSAPLARRDFVAGDFSDGKLSKIISEALSKRLEDHQMAALIHKEILRSFFADKDRQVHYRKEFRHEISFEQSAAPDYYLVKTTLSYRKVLDNESFIIACATDDAGLRRYFARRDVEYRWLLDEKLQLNENSFQISSVKLNEIPLETQVKQLPGSLEIHCSHPHLASLLGQEALFEINTKTLYPTGRHQLSVFISELTQGVEIIFNYPPALGEVEPVLIFSGQQKTPPISQAPGRIQIASQPDKWVFPLSGVVFSY